MTKAEIIAAIAYRMGNVRGQDTAIELELGMAVNRLENQNFYPWFLLSENNFFEGTSPENRVPIPQGFLAEYEEGALYLIRDGYTPYPLVKKAQDQLKPNFDALGVPQYYALTNNYFRLFPAPAEDYKVELLFYRTSSTLTDGTNPWYINAAELVIAETIWAMLAARKSPNADYWKGVAREQLSMLVARDAARREANQEYTLGGDQWH